MRVGGFSTYLRRCVAFCSSFFSSCIWRCLARASSFFSSYLRRCLASKKAFQVLQGLHAQFRYVEFQELMHILHLVFRNTFGELNIGICIHKLKCPATLGSCSGALGCTIQQNRCNYVWICICIYQYILDQVCYRWYHGSISLQYIAK